MAAAERLMCYKSNLVLITNKRVSKIFHLNTDEVEGEINKVIEKRESTIPIEIFKKAVENLLPEYIFGDIRRKKYIYGEEICIHDQVFYRRYLTYILNNEIMKKKTQRENENNKKRKEFIKNNAEINAYQKEKQERIRMKL